METILSFAAVIAFFAIAAAPGLVGLAHERRIDRELRADRAARAAARAAESGRKQWGITA